MGKFPVPISAVVDLLGLEADPRGRAGMSSYNVRCPFCGGKKYYMNINTEKDTYHCFHCPERTGGGGTLDLYARAALGYELIPGREENGGNGNLVFRSLLSNLGIRTGMPLRAAVRETDTADVEPCPDEELDRVYTALLNLGCFALTDRHRENLIRRGFTRENIERNGYRSMPAVIPGDYYGKAEKLYERAELGESFGNIPALVKTPEKLRIKSLAVGMMLSDKGIVPAGVPGFFRVGGESTGDEVWAFRLDSGMIVPARNSRGLIVGLQTRKDSGKLRYRTVSSKGLPGGVTRRISRLHFPLANGSFSGDKPVLITEGPLKADAATAMTGGNAYFMAVQGVNNRSEVPGTLRTLRERGIRTVYDAFDSATCSP